MANHADSDSTQRMNQTIRGAALALVVGLAWGAIILVVFGLWMRSKYDAGGRVVTNIFLLAGAVAAGLAVWQAFTLWIKTEAAEQKNATLARQRTILAHVLLGAGVGLIGLAIYLGLGKLPVSGSLGFVRDNFAESFGALLLGLIALGSGYLLKRGQDDPLLSMQALVVKVPVLKLSQLVLSVVCLGTIGYLFFTHRAENAFLAFVPEFLFLLLMSVLCVAGLLWLNSGPMDEFGIRLFVLVFGGGAGFSMFVWSLCRTIVWRQDILLGGHAAWQGENAWHFWLCAYVLFFSLALMFASFNLARADIRTSAVLRRVMYGYDTVVQGLLLIGILIIFNVVVYALVPFTFDWTKSRGVYDLSESSKNLIAGLKQETHFIVLIPQNSAVHRDVRMLLDNCQALNNHVKVEYVSPDLDDRRYEELAGTFPKILPDTPLSGAGRGVLIVNGPIPTKGEAPSNTNAFVSERKLQDVEPARQPGEQSKSIFKGESELLKELKFLVQGQKQRKIYVLQGEDGVDFSNMDLAERIDPRKDFRPVGIGYLVDRLKKDNYAVFGLSFGTEIPGLKVPDLVFAKPQGKDKHKEIPADCETLVLAGITRDLPAETLDAIKQYLDRRNGRLLVFLDVLVASDFSKLQETNLVPLLKEYSVEVTRDIPIRYLPRLNDDPRTLLATTPLKTENLLGRQFAGSRINMRRSGRVVKPVEAPGRYKAETVLQQDLFTDRITLLEKDGKALGDPVAVMKELADDEARFLAEVSRAPVSLAVAVSEGAKPRMVVLGDTDFITNREILASKTKTMNYEFVVSALEWMAERESIGARPRETLAFELPSEVNTSRMVHLPGWLMLMFFLSLGVSVWVVRRR